MKKNSSVIILSLRLLLLLLLILFVESKRYSKPILSITIRDGVFTDLIDGLDPVISWQEESKGRPTGEPILNSANLNNRNSLINFNRNGIDFSGGIDGALRRLSDSRVWGKFETQISNNCDFMTEAEYDGRTEDTSLNFEISDIDRRFDAKLDTRIGGNFGGMGGNIRKLEGTKRFFMRDAAGGVEDAYQFSITPRMLANPYNRDTINNRDNMYYRDLVMEYGTIERNQNGGRTNVRMTMGSRGITDKLLEISHSTYNTAVDIVASRMNQEVTVSQRLDDDNRVSAKMNNYGDLTLSWQHIFDRRRNRNRNTGRINPTSIITNRSLLGMGGPRSRNDIVVGGGGGGLFGGVFGRNKNILVVVPEEEAEEETSLKATLQTRDDSILLEFKDGPWTANVDMPLYFFNRYGTLGGGGLGASRPTTFRINRKIELTTP